MNIYLVQSICQQCLLTNYSLAFRKYLLIFSLEINMFYFEQQEVS